MTATAELRAFDSQALTSVSACLKTVGGQKFNQAIIDLAIGPLAADQCMIFSYGPEKTRCFLSHNNRPRGEARALAEKYVVYGHENDPIQNRMQRMSESDAIDVVPLGELKNHMTAEYWGAFYEAPGLVDKIAILAGNDGLKLCLNFYRYEESGAYSPDFMAHADPLFRIAAQLTLLHYQSSADHSLEDPLLTLSDREQKVCRWMLKGLTTEAIAYEMDVSPNTISTFRKRAYEKLSINSKSALFALCQP